MSGKILYLIETGGPGGAENMFLDLICFLRERGYEPRVVLLKKKWLWRQLESRGIHPVLIESRHSCDWRLIARIVRFMKREKIDLVHSHLLDMNVYSSLAARVAGIPHLATEHGDIHHAWKNEKKLVWKMRLLFTLSNRIIAVSKYTAGKALEMPGAKRTKIDVIYNGIELDRFRRKVDRCQVRRSLGVPTGVPWILNVGNLYPVKGQLHLLRAFALTHMVSPDAVLSIFGRGAMETELRSEIQKLGLQKHVFLHGFREDIDDLLGASDLFVLSSLSEGLPLSLLEAMASGVPVIATDVGGIAEIVFPGKTGTLVPAGKEVPLAEALTRAISNPDEGHAMAENASRLLEEYFSLKVLCEKYEAVYKFLMGHSRPVAESKGH